MFNFFGARSGPDINQAAEEAAKDPSIRLLDVRTREEYQEGHIPGSVNLPLDRLDSIQALAPDKSEKIYVYCASGARSALAANAIKRMGYSQVIDAGGIRSYRGAIAR